MMADDKKNNKFKYLIASLLFIIIAGAGIEILLRIVQYPSLQYYRNLKLLHVYSPRYMVGLQPKADIYLKHHLGLWEGKFTTSSMGFRGSPELNRDASQIGCIGDSVVMGYGVSDGETFCSYLNGVEIRGKQAQAHNLGVDAFGSRGSFERLKEATEKVKFDAVIFVISPNDFVIPSSLREKGVLPDDETDALRWDDEVYRKKFYLQFEATRASYSLMAAKLAFEQLQIKWFQTKMDIVNELTDAGLYSPAGSDQTEGNSRISRFARYFRNSFIREIHPPDCERKETAGDSLSANGSATTSDQKSEELMAQQFRRYHCPSPMPSDLKCDSGPPVVGDLEELPEITKQSYNAMIELAQQKGFRLIPVFLPIQNEEIHCAARGEYHPLYNYALRAKNYFEQRKVKTLDLLPVSASMCGEPIPVNGGYRPSIVEDYYIPGDGHYTVIGNRIIGRTLREQIRRMEAEHAF